MNQLEYWFDAKKKVTESQIKEKFQLMMYSYGVGLTPQGLQVFNAIWSNTVLRGNLWSDIPTNPDEDDKNTYQGKFEDIVSSTNSSFYNFIKVK